MRRILTAVLALAISGGLLLQTGAASANNVAGGGYSSSYAGESVFTNATAGETGQFSAIFFNDGSQPWSPGVVGLLVCAADKTTCNVTANNSYKANWVSNTVYATVTSTVQPGQNGFFIYDFTVPFGTPPGTVTTFYGDVGLIATGAELRPEGYFQINTTPQPTYSLTLSPATPSVSIGTTQKFTVTGLPTGAIPTWAVNGGCGAITDAGLFAATSVNSAAQPCLVVASFGGASATTPVIVYGQASQLSCSASPVAISANGGQTGGTSKVTIAMKDINGNVVANASTPDLRISASNPTVATATPLGPVTPIHGIVEVAVASTLEAGLFQISASGQGLTGCFVNINTSLSGPPVGTLGTFQPTPIAADAASTSIMRIDVVDAAGARAQSDNQTILQINGSSGSDVCQFTGITGIVTGTNVAVGGSTATATVANGRVELTVKSTTTPGSCSFTVLTNNQSIAGTTVALQTQIVGAANQIAVISSESPKPASAAGGVCTAAGPNADPSCIRVVVEMRDYNGARITSDNGRAVVASLDPNTCTTAAGGAAQVMQSSTTVAGRATIAFRSPGTYAGCVVTINSAGLSGTSTTLAWTGGGAHHLMCTLLPARIAADAASEATGQVTVRDAGNNIVTGYNYSVIFNRTFGLSTMIIGTNQKTLDNGFANFTVRSTQTVGTDTYSPMMGSGGPTLTGAPVGCSVIVG
jgi:hypothetical protein